MKRKSISKKVRFSIFHRDKFACQYCGKAPPDTVLEIDHILAVANGGTNEDLNLITSCQACNNGKGVADLACPPKGLSQSIAEAKEKAEQLREYNAFLMSSRDDLANTVDSIGTYWYDKFCAKGKFVFAEHRRPSIKTFLERLPQAEILDAVDIAFSKTIPRGQDDAQTWRYFCGVCWRKIERKDE